MSVATMQMVSGSFSFYGMCFYIVWIEINEEQSSL